MRADQLDLLRALVDVPEGLNTVELADATGRAHYSARRGALALVRAGLLSKEDTTARQTRKIYLFRLTPAGGALLESLAPPAPRATAHALTGVNSVFNWR